MTAIEERRTLEKLGGGKNSLFSAISNTQKKVGEPRLPEDKGSTKQAAKINSLMRKLHGMGLNEQDEDKLLASKILFTRMDRFKRAHVAGRNYDKSIEMTKIRLRELPSVRRRMFDLERGVHLGGIEELSVSKS